MDASQGRWVPFIGEKHTFAIGIKGKSVDQVIAWSGFDNSHESRSKQKANCKYISAAQPQAILLILDELEALKSRLANIECQNQKKEYLENEKCKKEQRSPR